MRPYSELELEFMRPLIALALAFMCPSNALEVVLCALNMHLHLDLRALHMHALHLNFMSLVKMHWNWIYVPLNYTGTCIYVSLRSNGVRIKLTLK